MAEGHVVDAVEDAGGDRGDTADRDVPLAVAALTAGDEGVREDHGTGTGRVGGEIGADAVHGGTEDRLMARLVHRELVLYHGRFQIRQPVEGDRAVRVGQQYGGAA